MTDYRDELTDQDRAVLEGGQQAWRRVKKAESLHTWVDVGKALDLIQRKAMLLAHTNQPTGKLYQEVWKVLAGELAEIDPGARSHAIWLANNIDEVMPWWEKQKDRYHINHPRTVRRKYEAFQTAKDKNETGGSKGNLPSGKQLEALIEIKRSGIVPQGMKVEDLAETMIEQMSADLRKRFYKAFGEFMEREAVQDGRQPVRRKK
jgi:hypothetical protein